jgi:hypothetical protein
MEYLNDYTVTHNSENYNHIVADYLHHISHYTWDYNLDKFNILWDDHEEDMEELSLLFPNVLFTLECFEVEISWKKYFKDGIMIACIIE